MGTDAVTKRGTNLLVLWIFGVAILLLLAVCGYLFWQNVQAQQKIQKLSNPQAVSQAETDMIVKKVGAIVALPGDETPTIATVVDYTKLQSQPFFANAQNGDKALLYAKAKKAYLYRPVANKLIEVAALNINKTDLGADNQVQPSQPAAKPASH